MNLLALAVLITSAQASAQTQNLRSVARAHPKNIVDLAVATPDLSTLVAALKAGDLVDTLSGSFQYTVFAPTNEAFDALPAGVLANLLEPENKAQLVDLLLYHVAAGDVHAKDLVDTEMLTTVEGKSLTVRISGSDIFINSAKVTAADNEASNGVVHIIDAVLMPGDAPTPPGKSIVDLAVATPSLSTLVTALKAASLTKTLSGEGPFTVFAPTNTAFAALPAGVLANLLKPENKDQLVDVLTYHVAAGDVESKDLMDMEMLTTVEGKNVTVRVDGSDIFINSAKVTAADNKASNGVVHIIDAVLMPGDAPTPPGKNIVDLAVATPSLSTLVTALKAAGLVGTLSGKGPFTVFAPTNEAFAALPAGVLANLLKPENKDQLVDVLTYHVAAGDVESKDLMDMQMLTTVEGKNVTVRTVGSTIFINSAKVTAADNEASNGVVHIIDTVLTVPDQHHLWFRGWKEIYGPHYQCGEIDAGPRMPAAIFEPQNAASLKAYADITIALFPLDVFSGYNAITLELGRCATNNYTADHHVESVDWAGIDGNNPLARDATLPLMDGICQVKCHCNFRGLNKTVSTLPRCTDEPDDPKAATWCSLCGPKYNKPIEIDLYQCTTPGVTKDVCPGPKTPPSRTKQWEQVLADLLGST